MSMFAENIKKLKDKGELVKIPFTVMLSPDVKEYLDSLDDKQTRKVNGNC